MTHISPQQNVVQAFQERYGEAPAIIVRAPGRVNLIGEHTDYNDGFVLPMAIERAIYIALRPRQDNIVHIDSLDFDEPIHFDLAAFEKSPSSPKEYVKGMTWALQGQGYVLQGWEGIMQGDIPIGAGLSSSAALELATARAFHATSDFAWHPAHMAQLAQRAENKWVGVNCGIMDQMISAAGEDGHALLIDCRTLETISAPLPAGTVAIVLDTGTRRGLVDSAYNERRQQCETAAQFFGVSALRDVTLEQFNARADELDALTRQRARHVITENARTLEASQAMQKGDANRLGQLMDESHISLRDDFEVSSPALNTMVELARQHPACLGARMTGAGFGGCAVALVREEDAVDFAQDVAQKYQHQTPHTPQIYISRASAGANVVTSSM
jgi:galactokinase